MRLLLVDSSSYLFRAYHAVGDLRAADGHPTGAIHGTLTMLHKLLERYPAQHLACVRDYGGPTFRHQIAPEYKANRPTMPPDLARQIEPLYELIRLWGWPIVGMSGVEADDVIAALTTQAVALGMEVVIASSDKDLMQLVGDSVFLYDGMKEQVYDTAAVVQKFAVRPDQMLDYLTLVGDSSDNVAGVRKVGAKTAAKWLHTYGSLAAICEQSGDIKGVVGKNLKEAITSGQLDRSRQLITLKQDVAVALQDCVRTPPEVAAWRALCERYGLRQLATVLREERHVPNKPGMLVTDRGVLEQYAKRGRKAGCIAIDTETIGEPVMQAQLVGFSLAVEGDAIYVPLRHNTTEAQLSVKEALAVIAPLLADESIIKILHNGKYDWHVLAREGVILQGVLEDTRIAAYVLGAEADITLAALAQRYMHEDMRHYRDVVDGKTVRNFAQVPLTQACAYASHDALVTYRLCSCLRDELSSSDLSRVYTELDRPLMPLLAKMERAGMRIEQQQLTGLAKTLTENMRLLTDEAHEIAGGEFNLNSARQLESVLFDTQGARVLRKTGGGARSTDERTLKRLADDYPLAKVMLRYRAQAKLLSTYAQKLPTLVWSETGRVHTTFSQTSVVTGRLSSSSPNLQNIPIRSEEGRHIRRAFIAEEGSCLISVDYSQIELRLMAHMAGDTALCAAFCAGADIHRQTAAEIFGVPLDDVSAAARYAAKAINFGLIYGMSAFGLARNIDISSPRPRCILTVTSVVIRR